MGIGKEESSLEARREMNRLNALRVQEDENKKKNIVNLIGKIAVIVCVVIYMFSGSYQSLRSDVRYYKNNPDAKSFEEKLADAIESGSVQAYGPNVNQFVESQKNASSRRNSAINTFTMLNVGLYVVIIVCAGLAGRNIYQINRAKKEILEIDAAIANASEPGKIKREKPIYVNEFTVKCPRCSALQSTGRKMCLKCSAKFDV